MRILMLLFLIFSIAACGGKKKGDASKTSELLSTKLKNTSWIFPGYEVAGMTINKDSVSVSMSESSFISNASIEVLETDPESDFVVFYLSDSINSGTFALSLESPETIKISLLNETNSLEGYKERHKLLGTILQKKDYQK